MSNYFESEDFQLAVTVAVGNLYTRLQRHPETESLQINDREVVQAFRTLEWQVFYWRLDRYNPKDPKISLKTARATLRRILEEIKDPMQNSPKLAIYKTLIDVIRQGWETEEEAAK